MVPGDSDKGAHVAQVHRLIITQKREWRIHKVTVGADRDHRHKQEPGARRFDQMFGRGYLRVFERLGSSGQDI
jgi:hypothetical protein